MYIQRTLTGYDSGGQQVARRGPFLLLIQPDKPTIAESCSAENTFAIVRRVALQQFGHFMTGRANIGGRWFTVSGAYGNDGLPMSIPFLPRDAVLLPPELFQLWSKGGGHNSAGNEAAALKQWARETFKRS